MSDLPHSFIQYKHTLCLGFIYLFFLQLILFFSLYIYYYYRYMVLCSIDVSVHSPWVPERHALKETRPIITEPRLKELLTLISSALFLDSIPTHSSTNKRVNVISVISTLLAISIHAVV